MSKSRPKSFSQSITIKAKRSIIYEALVSGKLFSKITGAPAEISPTSGSYFSAYGGYLFGWILDSKKSKYLVQAWRTQEWAPGDFSLLRFTLSDDGKNSTRIDVHHYGIPAYHNSSNAKVWEEFYWSKFRKAFKK
ncbi:MAG: SRPBCC domain-containing protein [Bdellovibrionales bacterium]|nr:SRPBCC domain-containing protein [Bdellovibrionales bacterium]